MTTPDLPLPPLPPLPLHHVGIIRPSEQDAIELMQLLGLQEDYRGFVPQWSALCIFTRSPSGSPLEFVIPDGGPLEKFNKGAGGIHHIAMEVADLDEMARILAAQGMKMLEESHVKGAGPFLCNFLSPIYTRGVQVEFVQLIGG